MLPKRIIEAYVGEYASGKSEVAINRALELLESGHETTLVDLDIVEPFYTLRPLKEKLISAGLNVIGFSQQEAFGLGETGAMLHPQAKWILMREGSIIIDVGYGIHGIRTLNLVEGAYESPELKVIAVINGCRPMTNSASRIKEYFGESERIDGIVANTHLGDETTVNEAVSGNQMIVDIAKELGIPLQYVAIDISLRDEIEGLNLNWPIKYITRQMPQAMW